MPLLPHRAHQIPSPDRLVRSLAVSAVAALLLLCLAALLVVPPNVRLRTMLTLGGVALLLGIAWVTFVARLMRAHSAATRESATAAASRTEKLATTGRLAAGIAHEVGNPLSAIANYAHLVRQRAGDSPAVAEPLDALEREVDRIDRIVRGLLDYARPRRMTPKAVVVDGVIDAALQLLRDQGVLRRVEVARSSFAEGARVFGERQDLEQVFVNLVLNSVDAMQGIGSLTITSQMLSLKELQSAPRRRRTDTVDSRIPHSASRRAQQWLGRSTQRGSAVLQIIVADSGPGISNDNQERVFEPFFSTKEDGRGTGLGLAIVAQTVDGLGGTVFVQPSREGGASLVLLLPLFGETKLHHESE